MSTNEYGKYFLAADLDEGFRDVGYDTREEAIAAAPTYLDLAPGAEFWTAQLFEPAVIISGRRILEDLRDHLYDETGDDDASVLDCSIDAEHDLGEMLTATLRAWMAKHDVKVGCYAVEDTQRHRVPDGSAIAPTVGGGKEGM